ncbi:MAG: hypothetical protein Q4G33_04510 [bacterium]|nr:hypothetical protein [bacterium]
MSGLLILGVYLVVMVGIAAVSSRKNASVRNFNVADGNVGKIISMLSIAATWIWAPALFTSAEKAYTSGIAGLFWFLVPNVVCLMIFAPFALYIRKQFPQGMTISGYMGNKYDSKRVRNVYLFQTGALSILSTAVQLLAGGKVLSMITDLPYTLVVLILAVGGFLCAAFSGIKGSIITDAVQFILIAVSAVGMLLGVTHINGVGSIVNGLGGASGAFKSLFDKNGMEVFLGFGLSSTIGLLSGPFGDQAFWQRAFSIKGEKIKSSFIVGAMLFGLVPLIIGIIGFAAAGAGYATTDTGTLTFNFIAATLPSWVIVPFVLMMLSGLLSTVDSNMCAISSLSTDMFDSEELSTGRSCMIIASMLAVAVAHIPGLTVTHLFLFYGTLRASTMLPTIMTLRGVHLSERGIFTGIILSLCIGLPLFAYGNIANDNLYKVIGSLATLLISGLAAVCMSKTKEVQAV